MSEEIGKFLKSLRESAGLSQRDVYEKIGVKQSTYSSWESGRHEPSGSKLIEICRLYDLAEIVTIVFGEMSDEGNFYLNEGEYDLIKDFRRLENSTRFEMTKFIHFLADHDEFYMKHSTLRQGIPHISIPVFDLPASAGNGIFLDSDNYELVEFTGQEIPQGTNFAVKVSGDSMEPDFTDGDIVFVKQTKTLTPGDVGIFILNSEGYIKQLGEDHNLVSYNEKYPDIHIDEYDDLRVIGKVLAKHDENFNPLDHI